MPQRDQPRRILLAAIALVLAGCIAALAFALAQPSAGLRFAPYEAGSGPPAPYLLITESPSDAPPAGALALAVEGPGGRFALSASDMIEEPDFFDHYEEMARFFERQSQLAALLAQPQLTLHWQAGPDAPVQVSQLPVARHRPLASLPGVFWFQLFVGSACLLIGAWVFALRPASWGARMLALSGLMFALCAYPAAAYSTRELAIDGVVFRWLASLNHVGTLLFGSALVAIFMCHPHQLLRPRWLLAPWVVFGLCLVADVLRWAPDQNWGVRLPVMAEMLLAIVLGIVQWRRSRGQPAERAALRWFALSALVGSGLFVTVMVSATFLGLFPPVEQGYAFGFFLIMFFGLALGVGRYRLFDLDEWAYRVLLWALGVAVVVVVDALLVLWLRWNTTLSLGATLLLCGALYFPARQWLWGRLVERGSASVQQMLPELVRIAFSASAQGRERLWAAALQRLYNPLQNMPDEGAPAVTRPEIADDGLTLRLPASGGTAARTLRHRDHGKRLFSGRDAEFTASLCQLMDQAAASRDAHERGVQDERLRLARDMHDDLGAKLLTLLHVDEPRRQKAMLRETLTQLRAIVHGLSGQAQAFDEFLADLRHVTMERTEAAGVALDWDAVLQAEPDLSARQQYQLRAAFQELVSNALRHAQPARIQVRWQCDGTLLSITVADDGPGMPPVPSAPSLQAVPAGSGGLGLGSVQARMGEIGASVRWEPGEPAGTRVTVELPVLA